MPSDHTTCAELPGTSRKLTAEVDAPKLITLVCCQCGRSFEAPRKARGRHRGSARRSAVVARAAEPWASAMLDQRSTNLNASFAAHHSATSRRRVKCCSRACGTRLAISTKRAKSIAKRAADAAANGGSDKSATRQLTSSVPRHEQTAPSPAQVAAARQGVAECVRQSAAQGRSGLVSNARASGLAPHRSKPRRLALRGSLDLRRALQEPLHSGHRLYADHIIEIEDGGSPIGPQQMGNAFATLITSVKTALMKSERGQRKP